MGGRRLFQYEPHRAHYGGVGCVRTVELPALRCVAICHADEQGGRRQAGVRLPEEVEGRLLLLLSNRCLPSVQVATSLAQHVAQAPPAVCHADDFQHPLHLDFAPFRQLARVWMAEGISALQFADFNAFSAQKGVAIACVADTRAQAHCDDVAHSMDRRMRRHNVNTGRLLSVRSRGPLFVRATAFIRHMACDTQAQGRYAHHYDEPS
jgi:hypothetical protein